MRIREIADAHGIPSRFLVQILLQLKAPGLVQSVRGASGGYQLAREPEEITLLEVMTVVDASLASRRRVRRATRPRRGSCIAPGRKSPRKSASCSTASHSPGWSNGSKAQPEGMYYI